ncbi:methyltransferase domain-containing protein [Arthrobacter sp. Sa2CUA1]|uniref:Methyltransferase domain-containing protein n=1 Tax=Arthrobacter gallicola TaxID=2762225 RepID=A0ABR8UVG6_9MICC|nr:class I SAM-dependent methyltransferase [Arthrobacter gallicola]MBD7996544.1 methyltransferase domain-containing protein [Arthrobacter gallicola]
MPLLDTGAPPFFPPDLSRRAVDAVEEMDRPDCDPVRLERTYAQFPVINAVVSGWRRNYRRFVRPALSTQGGGTVLDIGSGGGDLARALARWAHRDGLTVAVTGIDPDPRAHTYAESQPAVPGLTFRAAFSSQLVAEGQRFDVVLSNHVLHHLDTQAFDGLLADSQALARALVLHSDIERSPWAYGLFSAGTLPFFHGSFIRADGLTSIRRSYTSAELAAAVPAGWEVRRQRPWQNLLLHRPGR